MQISFTNTSNAPQPVGAYSQAVKAGDMIFCSGQLGIDIASNQLVAGGIAAQGEQIFKNLSAVLAANQLDLSSVVKCTVFLTDMSMSKELNQIYGSWFKDHKPARSMVEVSKLPLGAIVEIEAIAVVQK